MLKTLLMTTLILASIAALPVWSYSLGWSYYLSSALGFSAIALLMTGHHWELLSL